jgi:K+ transporter
MNVTTDSDTQRTPALALAALGIVFGDIGTSPLYAVKACFSGFHAVPVTPLNILGVLSLIFWSLTAVISIKYVSFVMRADNQGEGGIVALFSLLPEEWRAGRPWVMVAALFGAALLYGDGFITPSISVLAALEGLSAVTARADAFVVPATCAVLVLLFAFQSQGTRRIGRVFGPVMLLWFLVLAWLGARQIVHVPAVLAALDPSHAVRFFVHNGWTGAIVLGAVVLCITGGEALYADMGHFGRRPIRLAWYGVAMPALLVNYFGQGALLLADHGAASTPFYGLVPRWMLIPMVVLATCATIIASQAIISGVYSLTRQAVQLGYLPRVRITHTSDEAEGQIYCPMANWLMAAACLLLVVSFRTSDSLAGAYGIAITSTMCITTVLYFIYLRQVRGWPLIGTAALCAFFMLFDLGFLGANLSKLLGGGWIPLAVAGAICLTMLTWARGRAVVRDRLGKYRIPLDQLPALLKEHHVTRTPGTSVFLSASPRDTPPVLLHHIRLTGQLKEHVLLFSVITEPVPRVDEDERLVVKVLDTGISRVVARFGFAESPNVPLVMQGVESLNLASHMEDMVYFLGRETLTADARPRFWKSFYIFMARNSTSPVRYYRIPADRVIEIGMQVEL